MQMVFKNTRPTGLRPMCVLFSNSFDILGKNYKKRETSQEIGLQPVKVPGTNKKTTRFIKDDLIFRGRIFDTHIIYELHNSFVTVLPTSSLALPHLQQPIFYLLQPESYESSPILNVHQTCLEGLLKHRFWGPCPEAQSQ